MLGKIKSTKIDHVTKYKRFSGADTGLLEMVDFWMWEGMATVHMGRVS